CYKSFGDDAKAMKLWFEELDDIPFDYDESIPTLSFPRDMLDDVRTAFPEAAIGESVNVLEDREDESYYLREVALTLI
ncbi:MAG: hypothetical protein LUB61_03480, partial [Eggerthellaceae bacterium]|nr:hypothetical protein [Eggerthellaceae bacterium]